MEETEVKEEVEKEEKEKEKEVEKEEKEKEKEVEDEDEEKDKKEEQYTHQSFWRTQNKGKRVTLSPMMYPQKKLTPQPLLYIHRSFWRTQKIGEGEEEEEKEGEQKKEVQEENEEVVQYTHQSFCRTQRSGKRARVCTLTKLSTDLSKRFCAAPFAARTLPLAILPMPHCCRCQNCGRNCANSERSQVGNPKKKSICSILIV